VKKGLGWPIGISALLAVFVVANLFVMYLANDDPAFAIEPDYYRKAVAFDSSMATARRSATLGWSASTAIERADTRTSVTVMLADADRQPVAGASVTIDARFNARANEVLDVVLRERSPGQYSAPLDVRHAGQWEVRVDAVRGPDHFVTSTRADAPPPR
jgi:nitrogen fixation protein FixH